jgi:hypothetical protein
VKIALVTGADEPLCAVAEHTRALLPHLRELAEVRRFVAADGSERPASIGGEQLHPITDLRPREFDQVVYQVDDEPRCAFMPPVLRALGGTVALHSWALPNLAAAAFPALGRGGWRGLLAAVREGGPTQAAAWRRARAAGVWPADMTFNRSVIRHADAFLVHSARLGRAVREDRNARTALAVVPGGGVGARADEVQPWSEVARSWVEALGTFPHAHSARRPLVRVALQAAAGRGGRVE